MKTTKYLLLLFILLGSACANVHQIDRGRFARKVMKTDPLLPHQQTIIDDFHTTREGAAGGVGKNGGGGCGCK